MSCWLTGRGRCCIGQGRLCHNEAASVKLSTAPVRLVQQQQKMDCEQHQPAQPRLQQSQSLQLIMDQGGSTTEYESDDVDELKNNNKTSLYKDDWATIRKVLEHKDLNDVFAAHPDIASDANARRRFKNRKCLFYLHDDGSIRRKDTDVMCVERKELEIDIATQCYTKTLHSPT